MSEHYPSFRIRNEHNVMVVRDGLSLRFYMPHPHEVLAAGVMRTLERYRRVTGPLLGRYAADEDWWRLDDAGWSRVCDEIRNEKWANIHLEDESADERRFAFVYRGRARHLYQVPNLPEEISALELRLPTEMLEEHGPGHVRELILELAAPLPLSFGLAGLAFIGPTGADFIEKVRFRYPGFDRVNVDSDSLHLGTKIRGVAWLTFLGQPVLGELGGAAGLRARLQSPGTTVQELDGDRAVVTLGPWPEAGDSEQGNTLPAYRELARVLEPWFFEPFQHRPMYLESEVEWLRWYRRFLD